MVRYTRAKRGWPVAHWLSECGRQTGPNGGLRVTQGPKLDKSVS